ncbi:MAG: A24 family peptidase [Rhizobiaceae bacterium]
MLEAAILIVFPFAMAHAATSDLLTMTIANRVSIILIASFAVLAPLTGMDWLTYGMHFAAMIAVLAVCFGLFAAGVMGGGDAKLMASTSLWIGLNIYLIQYLVIGSLIGGLLTLLILKYRASAVSVYGGQIEFLRKMGEPKGKIPYGIALGLAGLVVFPETTMAQWVINSLT